MTGLASVLLPLLLFFPLLGLLCLRLRVFKWLRRQAISRGSGALRVAFVHPDLGIGGAERLVVDAAVAVQRAGHKVTMFTARHEPQHCFEETRDGTLAVVVYGDFLPRRVAGRLYAACAYARMCWVAIRLIVLAASFDVIIVDQVSVCLPLLWLARPCGIIFYCHYPDYLLTQRSSWLKQLYRAPLDWLEEQTTGLADIVFVNSAFTAGVFAEAFPSLHYDGVRPLILHPPLNLQDQDAVAAKSSAKLEVLQSGELLLLSINRFERKKNVGLAIRVLAALPAELRSKARLVLAGGYDSQLPENVEHAAELEELANELGVADRVVQMRSVSSTTKATLLRHAACLLYTPDKEHFGIVPVEAMYAQVPVVAVNSGGPLESIVEGETGFLRPQVPEEWAGVVSKLLADPDLRKRLGTAGRRRAADCFSLEAFGRSLDGALRQLADANFASKGHRSQ